MNDAFDIRGESHIEVHKFRAGAIIIATLLALLIQSSFPVHFAKAAILDLPLLITIYSGLAAAILPPDSSWAWSSVCCRTASAAPPFRWGSMASRKPSLGISLHRSAPGSIRSIPPRASALTAAFFVAHQGLLVLTRRILLAQPEPWFNMHLFAAALVNALVAVFLFVLLDRLRKN